METNFFITFDLPRNPRKERPSISSPKLLNPKYVTGEKWQNVILTIPDPKMKTRTPVPPPRKKRKSLLNLCTKRNYSVEYVNLCSCEDVKCGFFDTCAVPEYRLHSSEPELFKRFDNSRLSEKKLESPLRRTVSYEDVASSSAYYRVIKTSSDNQTDILALNSYINRCLLCYINDIMSLVEQLNKTNNEENKFKLDDSGDENDEDVENELMRESEHETEEQGDGTIQHRETKLSEINEQKLLESLENFCIHCYLNKIQTHPKEREDISSTSRKVKENNLKSFQTGDNNNFSLANKNAGDKTTLLGNTHDKEKFPSSSTVDDKESACANSVTESSTKPQHSRLDKKYECLFCCINKKKIKQKHNKNGSLYEIYSKKQENNVFKSDNTNEQECKYTVGNKEGDKRENKIRNEKLCEINNAQKKNIHDSNNMFEQFKNSNCCRRRHLNLFKNMCFQCFYVYVQILFILQSCSLFSDDFASSIFKIRKCEILRNLSIKDIRAIVIMVLQIHMCYDNNDVESNICKSCAQVLSIRTRSRYTIPYCKKREPKIIEPCKARYTDSDTKKLIQNKVTDPEDTIADPKTREISEQVIIPKLKIALPQSSRINKKPNSFRKTKYNVLENSNSVKNKTYTGSLNETKSSQDQTKESASKSKILQNFEDESDPSVAERRKNKFQILMANLNAKKIVSKETPSDDRAQLIMEDTSHRNHLEGIDNNEVLDDNGNYLHTKHTSNHSEEGRAINHSPKETESSPANTSLPDVSPVGQDPDSINEMDTDGLSKSKNYLRRRSIERKSQRLKHSSENSLIDNVEEISRDHPSRRSSVTDSLYELEASLYDILQSSSYLSTDDLEYV